MSSSNYNFNKSSPEQSVYYYQMWKRNWERIMREQRQRNNKRTISNMMTTKYTSCLLLFINNNNSLTMTTMSSSNYNNNQSNPEHSMRDYQMWGRNLEPIMRNNFYKVNY